MATLYAGGRLFDGEIERLKALGGTPGSDGPADPLGCGQRIS